MGSSVSQVQPPEVDDPHDFAPLPAPQVFQGTIGYSASAPVQILGVPTTFTPSVVGLTKMTMPFMLDIKRFEVRINSGKECDMHFRYMARTQVLMEITVTSNDHDLACNVQKQLNSTLLSESETMAASDISIAFPLNKTVEESESVFFEIRLHDFEYELVLRVTYTQGSHSVTEFCLTKSNGSSLNLLTLFVNSSNPASSANSALETASVDAKLCSVCLSKKSTIGFLPCRHVCVCSTCVQQTLSSLYNTCPICRSAVYGQISID